MFGQRLINPCDPIDWAHPLNVGRVAWWKGVRIPGWYGGVTLHNLVRSGHRPVEMTLTGGANKPTWGGSRGLAGASNTLSYDGVNSYCTAPNSTLLSLGVTNQSMTIGCWFTSNAASQLSKTLCGKTNSGASREYEFKTGGTSGEMNWQCYDGSVNPFRQCNASRFNGGGWHFIVGVRDLINTQFLLYLDGASINDGGSATGINGNFTGSQANTIGNAAGAAGGYWNGLIDDVFIFNRPLSKQEIVALWELSRQGYPGILNYWTPTEYSYKSSTTSYTLTASKASFIITGDTAALKVARKLSCAKATIVVTGKAAALKATRKLSCAKATYILTGSAAGLKAARKLGCGAASFVLSGKAAVFKATRKLSCAKGTYVLSGPATGLRAGRKLAAAHASFTVTGQTAILKAARKLSCGAAGFNVTGNTATLTWSGAGAATTGEVVISTLAYSDLSDTLNTGETDTWSLLIQ